VAEQACAQLLRGLCERGAGHFFAEWLRVPLPFNAYAERCFPRDEWTRHRAARAAERVQRRRDDHDTTGSAPAANDASARAAHADSQNNGGVRMLDLADMHYVDERGTASVTRLAPNAAGVAASITSEAYDHRARHVSDTVTRIFADERTQALASLKEAATQLYRYAAAPIAHLSQTLLAIALEPLDLAIELRCKKPLPPVYVDAHYAGDANERQMSQLVHESVARDWVERHDLLLFARYRELRIPVNNRVAPDALQAIATLWRFAPALFAEHRSDPRGTGCGDYARFRHTDVAERAFGNREPLLCALVDAHVAASDDARKCAEIFWSALQIAARRAADLAQCAHEEHRRTLESRTDALHAAARHARTRHIQYICAHRQNT